MQNLKKRIAFILIATLIMSLWPMTVLADPAAGTEYEVEDADGLRELLNDPSLSNGDIIKLKDNIVYTDGIVIYGISITFDLGDYDLNVECNSGAALCVYSGGEVKLLSEKGALNVTGLGEWTYGVYVYDGSSATVTNAYANGDDAIAAYADSGGTISIGGNAIADGERGSGAKVWDGTITVDGNVEASGVSCYGINVSDGIVTVKGDVTASGVGCQGAACFTIGHSLADIEGNITVSGDGCYGTYSSTPNSNFLVGGSINAYGDNSKGAYAMSGGTVTVGSSVTTDGNSSYAVYAEGADNMIRVGQDAVASGSGVYGVYADFGSEVSVGRDVNVFATGIFQSHGVYEYGGTTAIGGDIVGNGNGIICAYANNGGTLTVSGSAIAEGENSHGAYAKGLNSSTMLYSSVMIGENVIVVGDRCYGAHASDGGKVTVNGSVTAGGIGNTGAVGAGADNGGIVKVNGNATAIGPESRGAFATQLDSQVIITQSAIATGEHCHGASADISGQITVNSNISANGKLSFGAKADNSGQVIAKGNVIANGYGSKGVEAGNSGTITVSGNITASGNSSLGARAAANGAVNVDGSITAVTVAGGIIPTTYIVTDNTAKTAENYVTTTGTYANYLIYNSNPSTVVRVKRPLTPVIITQPSDITRDETQQAAFTVAATVSDGGIISYQWQKYPNGGNIWSSISGAINTNYTTAALQAGDNGTQYRCRVTNNKSGTSAAIYSNAATLTVNPLNTLISISTPSAITGLVNGTAKTAAALGLPTVVTMETNGGNISASINWDVTGCSYDAASAEAQTFEVTGSAILPAGVVNTNSVSLTISISVSVMGKATSSSGKSSPKSESKANIVIMDMAALNAAFNKAEATRDGVKHITIQIPEIKNVKQYALELPASILNAEEEEKRIEMTSKIGSITLPDDMLRGSGIDNSEKVRISLGEGDKSGLSQDVQDRIGSKPVIELKLTVRDKAVEWNNPDAPVMVSVPYTPTAEELQDPEHIVIWYIDGKGNLIEVPSGRYDAKTGSVIFSTTHFSRYAIAYVTKTFDDLGNAAWARKPIEVLASKGIVAGISEKEYGTKSKITRGDFLCFLIRVLNIEANFEENFDDVGSDAYYYKEIGAAKKLGITAGAGKNSFYPDKEISRQDMMVLTGRTLKLLDKMEQQIESSNLGRFSDSSKISVYAKDSIDSLVKEGLITGSGNRLNPRGNTTRAEAAVFLYRIYEKYTQPVK